MAKVLLTSKNAMFLRGLFSISHNSLKREYIDQGYFHVILKDTPIGKKTVTLVTGKGLYWLGQRYDHVRLKAI